MSILSRNSLPTIKYGLIMRMFVLITKQNGFTRAEIFIDVIEVNNKRPQSVAVKNRMADQSNYHSENKRTVFFLNVNIVLRTFYQNDHSYHQTISLLLLRMGQ